MQRYQEAQCYRNMSAIGIRTCNAIGTRNTIRARNAAGIRNAIEPRGVRTISRTAYEAYPSFLRYSSGLSHPSDSLILSLR